VVEIRRAGPPRQGSSPSLSLATCSPQSRHSPIDECWDEVPVCAQFSLGKHVFWFSLAVSPEMQELDQTLAAMESICGHARP